MPNGVPKRFEGGWTVPVQSAVSLVSIGPALGFEVWLNPDLTIYIRIQSPFTYIQNETDEYLEWDPLDFGRFAMLYGITVESINLSDEGHLNVIFGNGHRIKVGPDPRFEASEVTGPDRTNKGWRFVGLPDGGLAVWTD